MANDVTQVTVSPTKNNASATLSFLDGNGAPKDDADGNTMGHQADLEVGETPVKVNVASGMDSITYTVVMERDSDERFGWTPTKDVNTLTALDGVLRGVWGDESTLYVALLLDSTVYAYKRSDGSRDSDKDITLDDENRHPYGIWSDGTTLWVLDNDDEKLYAYTLSDGSRDSDEDVELNLASREGAYDLWGNETTFYVSDLEANSIFAYKRSDGSRDEGKDIALDGDHEYLRGIWSDGTTMWAVDAGERRLYAYTLATGLRDEDSEFEIDPAPGRYYPLFLWSDGSTMFVVPSSQKKLYSYKDVAGQDEDAQSDDATLSALSVLDGATELVSSFAADTTSYEASVTDSVTTVTVSATENDSDAEAVITPVDSDGNTMGHQVSLDVGETTITVTVTAEDDSTQDYTVTVTRAEVEETEETEEVVTLVSNADQPDSDQVGNDNKIAQEFTTGSNEGGYILSSVEVASVDNEGDDFSASLCTATSGGNPSSTCTDLMSPSSFARGTLTFTAPADTVLTKDTDYFVVFEPGSGEVTFDRVGSNSEDAGAAAGWSIGNRYHIRHAGSWIGTSSNKSLRIAVKGYAVSTARFEEGEIDFAQDTSTAGRVEEGGFVARGAITKSLDKDWFRVELEVGRTYQIVLWGALVGRDLTLGIPAINGLHDSDGGLLPNTYADFTGEEDGHEHDGAVPVFGGDAELIFSPGASGAYYVSVKGRAGYLGTYELWVADITEEDDAQPANTRTTARLTRNLDDTYGPVEGRIDYLGDQDWFGIIVLANTTYQIDLEGRDTGKGSLSDPYLRIYSNFGGRVAQVGTGDDDGGVGYNARITFTHGRGGTFYVAAQGFGRIGTYTLSAKVLED